MALVNMTQPLFAVGILKIYKSIYEEVKYDHSQCECKATQQSYIVMQKQSIHTGV